MIKIHKEGYKLVSIFSIIMCTVIVFISILMIDKLWISIPLIIIFLLPIFFLLSFFRVPDRNTVFHENMLYSPADGKIVAIEETFEDEYFREKRIQISVFMSIWDVHVNYFPFKGRLIYYRYHPGKFLIARHPKSSKLNERTTIVMENEKNVRFLVRQIAGIIARRIVCYARSDENFNTGEELGFIKFGSRVDIFLPLNSKILVKMNEQVYGKKTPLALM